MRGSGAARASRGSTRQVRGVQTQQADSGLVILNDREHTVIFMFLCKLFPDEVRRSTHGIIVVSGHIQPILPGNGLLRLPESAVLVPLRLDTLREETRLIAHHHIARHNHAIWTDCGQNRRSKETEILLIGRMALSRMQVTDLQQCDGLTYVVTVGKQNAPFTENSRSRSSKLIRESQRSIRAFFDSIVNQWRRAEQLNGILFLPKPLQQVTLR